MNGRRVAVVGAVLGALVLALLLRLVQLQIVEGAAWLETGEDSRTEKIKRPARRGSILDARGQPLAVDQPSFDLLLHYREFRRGDPARGVQGQVAAQLLEAFALLGTDTGGVARSYREAPALAQRLLGLPPVALKPLSNQACADLRFYLRQLYGIDARRLEEWTETGTVSLGVAFPEAGQHFEARLRECARNLGRLARIAGTAPDVLMERIEEHRLVLEMKLRRQGALQAAGAGWKLSVAQVKECLEGGVEHEDELLTREELLAGLIERWRLAMSADELAALLSHGTTMGAEATTEQSWRELGALLRLVERAAPKDVASLRRTLIGDFHGRDRPLARSVSFETADLLGQTPERYPGLRVIEQHRRAYPEDCGLLLVGRGGGRTLEEMEQEAEEEAEYQELAHNLHRTRAQDQRYRVLRGRREQRHTAGRGGNEWVGKTGLELYYESRLRGEDGYLEQVRTAFGRKGSLELVFQPPEHGENLQLFFDVALTRAAERAIHSGYQEAMQRVIPPKYDRNLIPGLKRPRAGFVLLDLRDGSVPVLASLPRFSDADYRKRYGALLEDPARPLAHRALGFNYGGSRKTPYPGSTFKPVLSVAALLDDAAAWKTEYLCEGRYQELYCDNRYGHGLIGMHTALMKSCNVYFYKLGEALGYPRIYEVAHELGFGNPTGLLGGRPGSLEGDAGRDGNVLMKLGAVDDRNQNVTRQIAIGQSAVVTNPLQMARVYGWLATGRLVTPRLVRAIGAEELQPHSRALQLPEEVRKLLHSALVDVVENPAGTAHGRGLEEFKVAGKTGTAQVEKKPQNRPNTTHSWFVGFFPHDKPRWAAAVYCENTGLHGGDCAALVLRHFLASPEAAVLFDDPVVAR